MSIFVVDEPGLPRVNFEGHEYVRFMERIYLPGKPYQLDFDQVRELSEIRTDLRGELIDARFNADIYMNLLRKTLEGRGGGGAILDFGSGDGSWPYGSGGPFDTDCSFHCVDISPSVIHTGKKRRCRYRQVSWELTSPGTEEPFGDQLYDGAIALFVMQFNVTSNQLRQIYKSLKNNAKFVFNYHWMSGDHQHFSKLILSLLQSGFKIENIEAGCSFYQRSSTKSQQVIVQCKKIETTQILVVQIPKIENLLKQF